VNLENPEGAANRIQIPAMTQERLQLIRGDPENLDIDVGYRKSEQGIADAATNEVSFPFRFPDEPADVQHDGPGFGVGNVIHGIHGVILTQGIRVAMAK
jgi:hypothetical protein